MPPGDCVGVPDDRWLENVARRVRDAVRTHTFVQDADLLDVLRSIKAGCDRSDDRADDEVRACPIQWLIMV